MATDFKAAREKYSALLKQSNSILDSASSQNRGVTFSEKNELDSLFAQMETIKASIDATALDAMKALASGKVQQIEPRGAATFHAMNGGPNSVQFDISNPRPLSKNESLFSAMNFAMPSVSLGAFMRAMVIGPQNEGERFALQSGSDNTGGFDVPPALAAQFVDVVRAGSVYVQAGALTLPLLDRTKASSITDPSASWRAEDASVTAATPFASVSLAPKSLGVICKISREQVEDSINFGTDIIDTVGRSMSLALDSALGFGGTSAVTGISATSGINAVTSATNGDQLASYAKILSAVYSIQSNNGTPSAAILSPREIQTLSGLADTTGQPLRVPASLSTLPMLASAATPVTQTQGSSSVASTILIGDFSKLLIAVRTGMRIELLRERYADNAEYGFLCTLRLDSVVTRPKSFCKITGIVP